MTGPEEPPDQLVLATIQHAVETLPYGKAEFRIGKHAPESDFSIIPSNPRSAQIQGGCFNRWVTLAIGQGTSYREISYGGGTILRKTSFEKEVLRICEAVFNTRFSETVCYNSSNQIVRSTLLLPVEGIKVGFDYGNELWSLFRRSCTERFNYEPYC